MAIPRDRAEAAALLGVPADAEADLIADRYRSLARIFHPDRNPDAPDADARMQELNIARDLLLQLRAESAVVTLPPEPEPAHSRRRHARLAAVMHEMPYGVYFIGTQRDGDPSGMIADWVLQISFQPRLILIAFERDSYSLASVQANRALSVALLAEDCFDVAGRFLQPRDPAKIRGRSRGQQLRDKLAGVEYWTHGARLPRPQRRPDLAGLRGAAVHPGRRPHPRRRRGPRRRPPARGRAPDVAQHRLELQRLTARADCLGGKPGCVAEPDSQPLAGPEALAQHRDLEFMQSREVFPTNAHDHGRTHHLDRPVPDRALQLDDPRCVRDRYQRERFRRARTAFDDQEDVGSALDVSGQANALTPGRRILEEPGESTSVPGPGASVSASGTGRPTAGNDRSPANSGMPSPVPLSGPSA